MKQNDPYETQVDAYEAWFIQNDQLFATEVTAIRGMMPSFQRGIEIGTGTGLFAQALGLSDGVEPAAAMRAKARQRGIEAVEGTAEYCPFPDESFDLALMVTIDCYIPDLQPAFRESWRILKPNGYLIIAFIDQATPLGLFYESKKESDPFYANTNFRTAADMQEALDQAEFAVLGMCQTVFSLENVKQEILPGTGKGVFAVIQARKV
ncbi:MAG: class I SAM-dependent methyltransferase [Clostridia bacterium]|nr:class I SAM-dependent methyltransferase [Clostridia bacterium]